ncbi:MAG: Eco57I restriction-modification methylase domain-containing protein, partial [Myxococcota bacterium]
MKDTNHNAREILRRIIENFSIEQFTYFFREKTQKFAPRKDTLTQYNEENFINGEKLGEIRFIDSIFIISTFKVTKGLTERSGKKKQYELGKKILKDTNSDAGIFIFYDSNGNFRFSLIYTEYSGTKRKFSYFKRFTFYVSPSLTNKTFLQQIGECKFTSLEEIKEAFSVEPVTKQFYEEIQNWYFWAMDRIKFPEDYKYSDDPEKDREIRNATNLIRLITRIIFIWFLKEKGLVPEVLFTEEKLKEVVKDFGRSSNYYNAILQNLFFATLNQKMSERRFARDDGYPANKSEYGVKTFYRYADRFLISKDKVLELFKEIPFLNGGLFDCLDKEDESGRVIYVDGFSRNPKKQAILPDLLFFQKDPVRVNLSAYGLGSNKPVRGLIEILKNYNFTIDENTPIDQEIALDPELLGKVFENLLASYNPETATTARKATGSYYTPREIVDYMVEESLKEYIKTQVPETKEEDIELLLSYSEEMPAITDNEKKIITAIDNIKILDPACGSGAFPMGILHKLVHILQKLDPENKHWYELQYQKALSASEEIFKKGDKSEREESLKEINEAFDENINYPDYARKLYLIENCIYGVDIQPIAIQISKLRFFISLVLDQKVDRAKENLGIRALPNLETKFVAANTLIEIGKPTQLKLRNPEIEKKEKELKELRHRYFTVKTRTEKQRLQQKDKKLREDIANLLIHDGWGEQTAKKIATFDLFDQNASADWFDPEWMFGANEGFDIVIGNPPYIKEYTNREAFNGLRDSPYYQGKMDIWYFFACKGIDLLKENGILTFIAQNNWVTSYGASKMRNKVIKDTKIIKLVDFGEFFIFESSDIQTMIMIFQKNNQDDNYQ